MTNQHGGSRPVVREDDGRLATQPGYEKSIKVRFFNKAEEAALKKLTPRQRVEVCLAAVKGTEQ